MGQQKLRGKDLRRIQYADNSTISLALGILQKHFKHHSKEERLNLLVKVKEAPKQYIEDTVLGQLAAKFYVAPSFEQKQEHQLYQSPQPFHSFGRQLIAANAHQQMQQAMRLPIAHQGALMPDAHHGYGLPIGGVLATKNAIIPYAVGLDIGCRMSLTIYDLKADYLVHHKHQLKKALKERTNFGTGGSLSIQQEHPILDHPDFQLTPMLRRLHGRAVQQLGTSGSGNHFVEFGTVSITPNNDLDLPAGEYVGLLAHSGSRGLGANIAKHYTDLAMEQCKLPKQVKHLAWLDMATEEGQEYWLSMNLAGEYAKACHDQIHKNLADYLGITPIAKIENHHNFAWKEEHDGETLMVHRKGATPAAKGELGIIPGSMTARGYIVSGKGHPMALKSASHGAGRKMSRGKTKATYTNSDLKKSLKKAGVTLVGGAVDEAPIAYKDLEKVMLCQKELVDVIGHFDPKIVRMDKG